MNRDILYLPPALAVLFPHNMVATQVTDPLPS